MTGVVKRIDCGCCSPLACQLGRTRQGPKHGQPVRLLACSLIHPSEVNLARPTITLRALPSFTSKMQHSRIWIEAGTGSLLWRPLTARTATPLPGTSSGTSPSTPAPFVHGQLIEIDATPSPRPKTEYDDRNWTRLPTPLPDAGCSSRRIGRSVCRTGGRLAEYFFCFFALSPVPRHRTAPCQARPSANHGESRHP